jgi:Fe-S cluster assembly iron-binding protein IscA
MVSATKKGLDLFAEFIQSSAQGTQIRISVKPRGLGRVRFIILPLSTRGVR